MVRRKTTIASFAGALVLGFIGISPVSAQQAPSHQAMPGMNMGQANSDNPAIKGFMEANEKMHRAMSKPMTGNVDRDFVEGMVPHHQGAIDMARIELKYGKDPKLKKLAQDIIAAQQNEIKFMKGWLAKHPQ